MPNSEITAEKIEYSLHDKESLSEGREDCPQLDDSNRRRSAKLQLDEGAARSSRVRDRWYKFWIAKTHAPPGPTLEDAPVIPLVNASIFSKLTYTWITQIMVVGYQRTLQVNDLYKLDETRESKVLSDILDKAYAIRVQNAQKWNNDLESGLIRPGLFTRVKWRVKALRGSSKGKDSFSNRIKECERRWREKDGRRSASLALALNDTFGTSFWIGGLFKVFGDVSQMMGPLLVKAIIRFGQARAGSDANRPSIGIGVGMAIGLFFIVVCASIAQHQFFWRSMTTGVLARSALIASLYKRAVSLTPKSRKTLTNSDLINHVSTDVSRIDACAQWFHAGWTAPIQVVICLIILLTQLGVSTLAGFSLFLLISPVQERLTTRQYKIRGESMKWTDKRATTFLELLTGIRIVKYFCYEIPFLTKISDLRRKELVGIRQIQFLRSSNLAAAYSIPVLAATLSFVTYTLTSHEDFDVAIIFSSFSLFQLLRNPLTLLPRALSAIADAQNALLRLSKVFNAPLQTESPFTIVPDQKDALVVSNASFEWETIEAMDAEKTRPFCVQNINLLLPRGKVVAIIGPIGSGKSSLLQGIIGEMRALGTTNVSVHSPRISYCAQSPYIENATLRDNILFGLRFDEKRYWQVIRDSCLLSDLQILPQGDMTEIGEKGVNLSGGQRQRVSIARALYSDCDVCLLDDPLSAVDANVARNLFHDAILRNLKGRGKSVIIVTHALHFLSLCDFIYIMEDGTIAERGTFPHLIQSKKFGRLYSEFGGTGTGQDDNLNDDARDSEPLPAPNSTVEGHGTVKETRITGAVAWEIYGRYIAAGRGKLTVPFILVCMLLMQISQSINSFTLVWWKANTWHRSNSFYQILYASMGISQALFTLLLGISMDIMASFASGALHDNAVKTLLLAKISFFDTTPLGRILGVFGKDLDSIDNQLPISFRLFVLTLSSVAGAVIVISILEPYFIIAAFFIGLAYSYFAAYYRESARELKRLDAMLRSILYAHFSESLSGLATIRCYGKVNSFIDDNQWYIDMENRALFLTVTNQRWLAIRLDFLGACMVFFIAILAVVGISSLNPAQIGLILTYSTSLTQLCGLVTRQSAEVENYMNSVERVVHYSRGDFMEPEALHDIPDNKPPKFWPSHGRIEFKDASLTYRTGLPPVLKNLNIVIKAGEKIGVVGRTGAGKSSLLAALFRMQELSAGSILIDGINIGKIGLNDLRSKISIIPQEALLFHGTVRSNLDPFGLYDDAKLWDALRGSFLTESGNTSSNGRAIIDLETPIEAEGQNVSEGERSLLSLARALVKDSRIVCMDEATASVDLETDSKIQKTIQTQFKDCTLICIAHRLRTILSYDRVLVLDSGSVVQFDTPMRLFQAEGGIFRQLCDRSSISLDELREKAQPECD